MPRLSIWFTLSVAALLVLVAFDTTADEPASPAEEKIRAALDGDLPRLGSGDAVLEDVIGIIKQRGSVLDGSSLDPDAVATAESTTETNSARAHVAEQLLKASRMLEQVRGPGDRRAELIGQMRDEARQLLSE